MISSGSNVSPPQNTRTKSRRAWFVFWSAIALVALPVLPIYFFPQWANDLPDTLDEFAERGRQLMTGWRIPLVNRNCEPESNTKFPPLDFKRLGQNEAKSLEQLAQDLVARVAQEPEEPSFRNQVGLIYAKLGDYHNASEHLKKSIDLCRSKISALAENERKFRANDRFAEASQARLKMSQLTIELLAAHSMLAKVYDKLGQRDLVLAEFDQLSNDIALGSDGKPTAQNGDLDFPFIQDHLAHPHRLAPQTVKCLTRAQALVQAKRVPESMAEFRRVIALDPQAVLAHHELGMAALSIGNTWLAVEELKIAAGLDPADPVIRSNLGLAYQAQGKLEEAKDEFIKVLKLNPDNVEALLNLGLIYSQQGQNGHAEVAFKRALRKDPHCAVAHNNLATLFSLSGNYKQAIAEFEEALILAPNLASSHYGLGLALLRSCDYVRSIQEFRTALALDQRLTDAHNKIEFAYRKAGLASVNPPGLN